MASYLSLERLRFALILLVATMACSGEHRAIRPRVVLVPMGEVSAEILAHLQRELPAILDREVTIAGAIALPAHGLDPARKQYRGEALLQELASHDVKNAETVVGIIDHDVYAPGLNFIFGQARKPGRFAVVALPRLRDSFYKRPEDDQRFRDRAVKVTVHELGHTFGFAHCPERTCVMHFANTLGEADFTGFRYCKRES